MENNRGGGETGDGTKTSSISRDRARLRADLTGSGVGMKSSSHSLAEVAAAPAAADIAADTPVALAAAAAPSIAAAAFAAAQFVAALNGTAGEGLTNPGSSSPLALAATCKCGCCCRGVAGASALWLCSAPIGAAAPRSPEAGINGRPPGTPALAPPATSLVTDGILEPRSPPLRSLPSRDASDAATAGAPRDHAASCASSSRLTTDEDASPSLSAGVCTESLSSGLSSGVKSSLSSSDRSPSLTPEYCSSSLTLRGSATAVAEAAGNAMLWLLGGEERCHHEPLDPTGAASGDGIAAARAPAPTLDGAATAGEDTTRAGDTVRAGDTAAVAGDAGESGTKTARAG